MPKEPFNIETQYKLFLKNNGLAESKMPKIQRIQTKRAFMGGFGQSMLLMRNEISALEEEQAMEQLSSLLKQLGKFWIDESNSKN